jgi:ribosomal protein S18 acetylase RimI-like enzyme
MKQQLINSIAIRQADQAEVPFALLLLADPSRSKIDEYLEDSTIYVATIGEEVIAVYVLYPISEDTIEIKNIAAQEPYQGLDIGKYMLDHASETVKCMGFKKVVIGTGNSSIAQLKLYQKQGFDISGIRKHFFIHNYPEPIIENGIVCRHLIVLTKEL